MFDTPVLFLIFNRPDLTKRVFAVIRQVKPTKLFIAADGPRLDRIGEDDLCKETRELVLQMIDWDCEVKTLFRESNLGCKLAVSGAINWFFEHVEEGIVLEDDCLPDLTFFNFCSQLLSYHRNDERVMHIGGACFLPKPLESSYYYTKYTHIWGWATWRRSWAKYDSSMEIWNRIDKHSFLANTCETTRERKYWSDTFQMVAENEFDTWDHQWTFAVWLNEGIAIAPTINLISNIGFSDNATHTKNFDPVFANLKAYQLADMRHPKNVMINKSIDKYIFSNIYCKEPWFGKLLFVKTKNKINGVFRKVRGC